MLLFVLAVTFSLVISFVCSLSEAALLSISNARVEGLAKTGSKAGMILRRFKQQPDIPISAILVLSTIANTTGAAIAGQQFEHALPNVSALWFIGTFTVAILLFTEIAPKTIGIIYANALAVPIAHVIQTMVQILRPVLVITRVVSSAIRSDNQSPVTSLEDIRLLATAGQTQGLFGSLTAGIIENATRLRETRVRDVMVARSRVAYLSGTRTPAENLELVRRTGHSRFPYTSSGELDEVEGVILTKELLYAARDHAEPNWQELLVPLIVVPGTATINHALRAFQREKRHMAIAVDEYGGVQGIVTLEDVLEEIVGEIEDELDTEEAYILDRPDGSLLCRGLAETRKVFAKLGLADVETESQTLSGFLAEQLGTVPQAGAELEFRGFRFTVTKANNRRAERVRVAKLVPIELGEDATE